MARPKAKAPTRRYHLSGQSVVTLDGRDYYLGPHDSPESIARYAVLVGVYQAGGLSMPDDFDVASIEERVSAMLGHASPAVTWQADRPILVRHVTALFRSYIETKYQNTPQEWRRNDRLCNQLEAKFGDVPADQFGPLKLKTLRDDLVNQTKPRRLSVLKQSNPDLYAELMKDPNVQSISCRAGDTVFEG